MLLIERVRLRPVIAGSQLDSLGPAGERPLLACGQQRRTDPLPTTLLLDDEARDPCDGAMEVHERQELKTRHATGAVVQHRYQQGAPFGLQVRRHAQGHAFRCARVAELCEEADHIANVIVGRGAEEQ